MSPCMGLLAWLSVTLLVGCNSGQRLAPSYPDFSSSTTGAVLPGAPAASSQYATEQPGTRSAQDIGTRIIRLARNLHTLDDISPQSIERHTGLYVEFNPQNRLKYGFGGLIAEPWHYDLESVQESEGSIPRQLLFSLRQGKPGDDAEMSAICKPSLQDYRDALVEAGFQTKRVSVAHRWAGLKLSRGVIHITLAAHRQADPDSASACLHSMRIYVADKQSKEAPL